MTLTIDTSDLRGIFLPAYYAELAALEVVDAAGNRSAGKSTSGAWSRAFVIVRQELCATVEMIQRRGGLLLIVPPAPAPRKGRRA